MELKWISFKIRFSVLSHKLYQMYEYMNNQFILVDNILAYT